MPFSDDGVMILLQWNQELLRLHVQKNTTPEIIEKYFENLEQILIQNNLLHKPHRIFNLDETGLQPEHKTF